MPATVPCTLVVDDIDIITRQLPDTGLASDAQPVRNDRVDTVTVPDPDGNSIAFAHAEDPNLTD